MLPVIMPYLLSLLNSQGQSMATRVNKLDQLACILVRHLGYSPIYTYIHAHVNGLKVTAMNVIAILIEMIFSRHSWTPHW